MLKAVIPALSFLVLAFGQTGTAVISGTVLDSGSGAPVELANVILYRLSDSAQVAGAATAASGAFRLERVEPGRYYLEISFVGFQTRVVDDVECAGAATLDLGRLELEPAPVPVRGAEATAPTPTISRELDKVVVDVTKLATATSGTAVDALRNVPSVKVDINDNVTVRGSSNFKVQIDGRPSELEPQDALKQIPAATIQTIEIITNPSARYEPDGTAGIINIMLKRQKGQGASGLANVSAGLKGQAGADVLAGYRAGIASAYAGGNVNRYAFSGRAEGETRTFGSGETLAISSSGGNAGGPIFGGARGGLDLQLGPRDKAGLSGRYRRFRTGGTSRFDVTEHYLPGDSVRQYSEGGGWTWQGYGLFGMADFEHSFDTTGHKLTARATAFRRSASSKGWSIEVIGSDTLYGRSNEEQGPWLRGEFTLDYSLPGLGPGNLEAGYDGWLARTESDDRRFVYDTTAHEFRFDEPSSHSVAGSEQVHAAYLTWSAEWHGFGFQPGLRGEFWDRRIAVTDTDSSYAMQRWDYFPSLHLSCALPANQQVTASYSRRINRPEVWDLQPLPVWDGRRSVWQGYPRLEPEFTDSWEGGYELPFGSSSLHAGAYYRVTNNLFQSVVMKYPPDTTALLRTSRNVGHDHSLGGELSADLNPWPWLSFGPGADVYDYRVEGSLLGQDFDRSGLAWSAWLSLTLRAPTNTQLQLDGNYTVPTVTSQGREGGWFQTDVALKQMFLARALSLTLRVGNLTGAGEWHSESEGPGFHSTSTYHSEPRVITLAVSYNVNNFKLDPKMRAGEAEDMQGGRSR